MNGKIALCQKRNQQFNWHGDFIQVKKSDLKKYVLSNKVKKYVLSSGTKTFYSRPEIDLKIARPLISTMHKMHRSGVDNYISLKNTISCFLKPAVDSLPCNSIVNTQQSFYILENKNFGFDFIYLSNKMQR